MNNEDKPFPCSIGSCKQRFANEDHLRVHCMKHEMSLKSLDTPIIHLDDTTPTPTRFLKNDHTADDGLFTDLVPTSTNPFDLEFRKASEKRRMSQDAYSVQTVPSLDTPDMKQSESDSGLGSGPILESASEMAVGDITSVTSVSVAPSVPTLQATVVSNPLSVDEVLEGDLQVVETAPSEGDGISLSSDSQHYGSQEFHPEQYRPPAPIIEQPPVSSAIQAQPLVQQIITHIQPQPVRALVPPISALAMAPLQAQACSLKSIVNSLPTNITAPLLIKLPDGQQIRVVPSIVANPFAPVPVAISANQKGANQGSPKSTVTMVNANSDGKRAIKERLKETLLSNQNHGNMNVMAKAVEVVRMREQQQVVKQEGMSYTIIAGTDEEEEEEALSPMSGTKRMSDDDDPDPNVKRQKFLERNRAAAMRCREKKKQWVTNLESKAENLTVTNVKLNNEILKLKNEVAHLKQLLLAHKDCPVTQMQQRQSQNWQVFHSIKETEEEIQSTKASTAVSSSEDSERLQSTVTEVSSTSPEGAAVMRSMSQSMRDAVRELTSHISDGGMTTITVGEGGVPTVIIN